MNKLLGAVALGLLMFSNGTVQAIDLESSGGCEITTDGADIGGTISSELFFAPELSIIEGYISGDIDITEDDAVTSYESLLLSGGSCSSRRSRCICIPFHGCFHFCAAGGCSPGKTCQPSPGSWNGKSYQCRCRGTAQQASSSVGNDTSSDKPINAKEGLVQITGEQSSCE